MSGIVCSGVAAVNRYPRLPAAAGADHRLLVAEPAGLRLFFPDVIEVTAGGVGQNEVQLICSTNANGGTFALVFDDGASTETTMGIGVDAMPSYVDIALEALSNVPINAVSVPGTPSSTWVRPRTVDAYLGPCDLPEKTFFTYYTFY